MQTYIAMSYVNGNISGLTLSKLVLKQKLIPMVLMIIHLSTGFGTSSVQLIHNHAAVNVVGPAHHVLTSQYKC